MSIELMMKIDMQEDVQKEKIINSELKKEKIIQKY